MLLRQQSLLAAGCRHGTRAGGAVRARTYRPRPATATDESRPRRCWDGRRCADDPPPARPPDGRVADAVRGGVRAVGDGRSADVRTGLRRRRRVRRMRRPVRRMGARSASACACRMTRAAAGLVLRRSCRVGRAAGSLSPVLGGEGRGEGPPVEARAAPRGGGEGVWAVALSFDAPLGPQAQGPSPHPSPRGTAERERTRRRLRKASGTRPRVQGRGGVVPYSPCAFE